jgi:hypothetical protein
MVIVATLFAALAVAAEGDPLFTRMAGDWGGEGERVFPYSGRRVLLKAKVRSRVEGDRLLSRNAVEEIPVPDFGGEPRGYVRLYWIRALGEGRYELGTGSGDVAGPTSEGKLDGAVFESTQDLGDGYRVVSLTEFADDGSVIYVEKAFHHESVIALTRISYGRSSSMK